MSNDQTATVELPLTPAHVEALRHHISAERQWYLGFVAFGATFGALLPLVPVGGENARFLDGLLAAGVALVIGVFFDWFFWRGPLAAALKQGTYFRTTGPIRISNLRRSGHVQIGDVRIKHVSWRISDELRSLPWGTIDYAPRTRFVVEQRDADGEMLYRYPGYRPDADKFDARPMPHVIVGILCGIGSCTVLMVALFALFALVVSIAPR